MEVMDEWSVFDTKHPHTLIIGPEADVKTRIADCLPRLRPPIVQWRTRAAVKQPLATGTLMIWDIAALDRAQQEQLISWMDSHPEVQVISIAEHSLFPLVISGTFLDSLYYRLNVLCLSVSEHDPHAVQESAVETAIRRSNTEQVAD
jgi:hypothetical protein